MDVIYQVAHASWKGRGRVHLVRPDRKKVVLCRAERNPYVNITPLVGLGRKGGTVEELKERYGSHLCQNCLSVVSGG
jgi:hypothetical protein